MNRLLRARGPGFALIFATACGSTAVDEYEVCVLDVTFEPTSGAPGTEIAVTGTTLTEVRDTRVEVGGVRATVSSVVREGCDTCDECRFDAGCAPCGLCPGLDLEPDVRTACFGDPLADPPIVGDCAACTESMVFVVPEVAPGPTSVVIFNRNGQSEPVAFEVLPGATTPTDTGADTATETTSVP